MRGTEVSEFIDLAYTWQERATKAEAEAERCIGETECYFNLKNQIEQLQTENAKLRAVVEVARGIFLGEGEHLCSEFEDAMDTLRQALAELDEEDTHD